MQLPYFYGLLHAFETAVMFNLAKFVKI